MERQALKGVSENQRESESSIFEKIKSATALIATGIAGVLSSCATPPHKPADAAFQETVYSRERIDKSYNRYRTPEGMEIIVPHDGSSEAEREIGESIWVKAHGGGKYIPSGKYEKWDESCVLNGSQENSNEEATIPPCPEETIEDYNKLK